MTEAGEVWQNIRKAQHMLRLSMDAAMRGLGLTTPQYEVLSALAVQAGLSGAALARRCFVSPQSITGVARSLEAAGLIAKSADPEHGRIIQARLTSRGAELFDRARMLAAAIEQRMLADLDRAERDALADLLAQCADALQAR